MLILKAYKGKIDDTYSVYLRKSFRVQGKVKKKDIYLFTLKDYQVFTKEYLNWDKTDYQNFWVSFKRKKVFELYPNLMKELDKKCERLRKELLR